MVVISRAGLTLAHCVGIGNLFVRRLNALPAFWRGAGHLRTGVINVDVVLDQTCSTQRNNRNATVTCGDALAWVGVQHA